jgi:hypothetical protein
MVSRVTDNWTETGITYANCPVKGADITSVLLSAASAYYEWDVTAYVQSQFSANDNLISFVFNNATADGIIVKFNSKEALVNTPQLYLVLNQVITSNPNVRVDYLKVYFNSNSKLVTIAYLQPTDSHVSAQLFSIDGQLIRSLLANESVGTHQMTFNLSELKKGFYLLKLTVNNQLKTVKLQIN